MSPGRYPTAVSARPLSLPAGEHQILASGGFFRGPAAGEVASRATTWNPSGEVGYRYGLTDQVDLRFPLGVGLLLLENAALDLAVGADVVRLAWTEAWLRPYGGDPREPNERVESWTAGGELSIASRRTLASKAAAFARVAAGQRLFGGRIDDRWANVLFAVVAEPRPGISLALTARSDVVRDWDQDETRFIAGIGGAGSDGYAPVPNVALHVREDLAVTGNAGIFRDFTQRRTTAFITFGIDLRFD